MFASVRLRSLFGLCVALLFLAGPPLAADTASAVASASSHLKRAEDNLALVDGSIGHFKSPPQGSAAKLSKMRLDQASGDLVAANKLLGGLTAGEGVDAAKARYDAATTLRDRLQGILDGGGAPSTTAPAPAAKPAPGEKAPSAPNPDAPKTVKLGYPHADEFKNTLFTLRRVETDTASLLNLREQLQPVEDPLTIDHRSTAGAMEKLVETRRQAGFVRVGLAKIPANGEGVAEAVERLANAEGSLNDLETYFKPLNARLMELVDPANYPDFAADVRRLEDLSVMYRDPATIFQTQRAQAAEAFSQCAAAEAECARIARTYLRLMEQRTEQGKRIEGSGNNFLGQKAAFLAAAEEQKSLLPKDIRKDLAEADKYAKEAVAEQKPMWFTGGIPQRMEWADEKLALYLVLDPSDPAGLQKEVVQMKASLKQRADSLKELIIRENPLPSDNFVGDDRDAAIEVAIDAWKHQEPKFELLAVRIPSKAWTRDTKWTYSNGTWYFVDKSTLQVRLIVADKENPAQAIDRPINVRKDHQSGDSMIGVPMRSFDEALEPGEYLLRDKIK